MDAQVQDQVQAVVSEAIIKTLPKFDELLTIAFTYTEGGRWHETQVSFREYLAILQSGTIDGRQICAVELYEYAVRNADDDSVRVIYDFVLLNTDRNPWRLA